MLKGSLPIAGVSRRTRQLCAFEKVWATISPGKEFTREHIRKLCVEEDPQHEISPSAVSKYLHDLMQAGQVAKRSKNVFARVDFELKVLQSPSAPPVHYSLTQLERIEVMLRRICSGMGLKVPA